MSNAVLHLVPKELAQGLGVFTLARERARNSARTSSTSAGASTGATVAEALRTQACALGSAALIFDVYSTYKGREIHVGTVIGSPALGYRFKSQWHETPARGLYPTPQAAVAAWLGNCRLVLRGE